jgi:hypothetical protein
MIADDDVLTVEWLSVNDICFGVPQVCDLQRAEHYRGLMADGGHLAPPMVSPDPNIPGRFVLRDGRHRYLAQLTLGRSRIRCLVVTETP